MQRHGFRSGKHCITVDAVSSKGTAYNTSLPHGSLNQSCTRSAQTLPPHPYPGCSLLSCTPAECHHMVCGLGCDVGVAVPVSPHPAAKLDGCGPQGQLTPCVLLQGRGQAAQEVRHCRPQRLLNNMQATTSLCNSAGGGWAGGEGGSGWGGVSGSTVVR